LKINQLKNILKVMTEQKKQDLEELKKAAEKLYRHYNENLKIYINIGKDEKRAKVNIQEYDL